MGSSSCFFPSLSVFGAAVHSFWLCWCSHARRGAPCNGYRPCWPPTSLDSRAPLALTPYPCFVSFKPGAAGADSPPETVRGVGEDIVPGGVSFGRVGPVRGRQVSPGTANFCIQTLTSRLSADLPAGLRPLWLSHFLGVLRWSTCSLVLFAFPFHFPYSSPQLDGQPPVLKNLLVVC